MSRFTILKQPNDEISCGYGISPKTVAFLRELGHDCIHLHDEGLDTLPDSSILEKAREESRVLLTSDLDFGELIAASGGILPSVVTFRLKDMRPPNVNRHLAEILQHHSESLNEGVIASVTEKRIRIRRLPIHP